MLSRAEWLPGARAGWAHGEHIAVVGPTGSGKSRLCVELLADTRWLMAIGTKPRDKTLDTLLRPPINCRRVQSWDDIRHRRTWRGERDERVAVWPEWASLSDDHGPKYIRALNGAWKAGNWTIYLDELRELGNISTEVARLFLQARSSDVSILAATQRPRWVPLEVWSQASYCAVFKQHHRSDTATIADSLGLRLADLAPLDHLPNHSFLWCDVRRGTITPVTP